MTPFVHLRSHTQFSFEDGLLLPAKDKGHPEIPYLSGLAAKDGQGAVALTDLHGMFGTISFYQQARKSGVKPIIGSDVWVDPDVTQDADADPVRINLLCQNEAGYKKLMALFIGKSVHFIFY